MTVLFLYLTLALGVSFICSLAEAVLLRVTRPYVTMLVQKKVHGARLLADLRADIEAPLAAILTLNTIAHTVGAVGVGAQAAKLFGDQYVALVSAILTLLVLVLSEIIPKTIGAYYWKSLAVYVAFFLKYLTWLLHPFVIFSRKLTAAIAEKPASGEFNREELAAMAGVGKKEGELSEKEARILNNLFKLRETLVESAMTPQSVVFSIPQTMTVNDYHRAHSAKRFSRIPVFESGNDQISGFVLRSDLLLAMANGNGEKQVSEFRRECLALLDKTSLLSAFELFLEKRAQIMYVVNEYGSIRGLLTMEDILETLTGLEFVDEGDVAVDMQDLARKLWQERAEAMGIDLENFEG